jgi:ankyrin repeat protein
MKFLISKGARLEETDGENVRGPLFYAVGQNLDKKDPSKEKRLAETVAYIIEEGKKTWKKKVRLSKKELDKMRKENQSKPWWEQNPFDVEWKEVIAPKVDIEEYDYEGWTALTLAAKYGQFESVKVLIEKGAIINHKERKMGNTALMYSRIGKFTEMEKFLLANCAKEGINFDHEELAKQGWKCVDGKEVFEKPAEK